jgi:acyl dehydratase
MSARTIFDELEVGASLRPVVRVPTREQLVRYAGAANDFSPIHFDDANARSRGFSQIIVHGLLKAAFLGEMLESWSEPHGGWVRRIRTEYRGVDLPGEPLVCHADVTRKQVDEGRGLVDLELRVENARGETTTRGEATVVFTLETRTQA